MRSASTGATARWKTCRRWPPPKERYSFLDGDNACALGASYRRHMINWIAGRWSDEFKCLVNHDGVFDIRGMGYDRGAVVHRVGRYGGTPWKSARL